jgi:DNA-binding PadR family transcriptional regulator
MSPVFRHGALRLYLLKLLDEQPRHGYDVIALLEDRFLGLYAPSAGTVYPRLARLEADGLIEHDEVDGRKVYRLTDAGREELRRSSDELSSLESDLAASVSELAQDVREQVRASARDLRAELKQAAREVRREARTHARSHRGGQVGELAAALDRLRADALGEARHADDDALRTAVDVVRRCADELRQILAGEREATDRPGGP